MNGITITPSFDSVVRWRPGLGSCGKPAKTTGKPCKRSRVFGEDGCLMHASDHPPVFVLFERARILMEKQHDVEFEFDKWDHLAENATCWQDSMRDLQFWSQHLVKQSGRVPACWSWDASPEAFAALRDDALADRRHRITQAGITDVDLDEDLDYEVMFRWHAHRCAICGTRGDTYIDHDHRTGLVRGFLCASCNQAEGFHSEWRTRMCLARHRGDPPYFIYRRYRERPPAAICGVARSYSRKRRFPEWSALAEPFRLGEFLVDTTANSYLPPLHRTES